MSESQEVVSKDAEPGSRSDARLVQIAIIPVVLLVIVALIWQNIHLVSRWTTLFVDRAAVAETCLTASSMSAGLPDVPRFRIGSAPMFSDEYHAQQNLIRAAQADRVAELVRRDTQMRVAAARSRDLELIRAASAGAVRVVRVCRDKRYPLR